MEFLKTISKRRTLFSEIIYIILNIGLAVGLMLTVRYTDSLALAILMVFISKWRVFAVRFRFWAANIQANAACFIVSFSYVIFLFYSNPTTSDSSVWPSWLAQIVLTLLYIGWLIYLKPKSKRAYVVAQAGVALFTGITAIYMMSYGWIAAPVVILVWMVGYSTARHVLSTFEEDHIILLSLAYGLVMAEIGWLAYHWTIAYSLPILTSLLIPQVSIIALAISFLAYEAYKSYHHYEKIRKNDIILPLVFSVGIIAILVLLRNGIEQIIL